MDRRLTDRWAAERIAALPRKLVAARSMWMVAAEVAVGALFLAGIAVTMGMVLAFGAAVLLVLALGGVLVVEQLHAARGHVSEAPAQDSTRAAMGLALTLVNVAVALLALLLMSALGFLLWLLF